MQVEIEDSAAAVLDKLRREKGEPFLTFVEDGCCSFSNVFVRLDEPGAEFVRLPDVRGFKLFIRNTLYPMYRNSSVSVHAMEKVDDSFSAETEFGYKLTMTYTEEPPKELRPKTRIFGSHLPPGSADR